MQKFLAAVVRDLTSTGIEHRFSLVTYNSRVQLAFSLKRYRQINQIEDAILTTRYNPGGSNIADAIRTASEVFSPSLGDRSNADNIAMLFTVGKSSINSADTIEAAEDIKYGGARFVSVGVGVSDPSEIKQMVSSQNDLFQVASASQLSEIRSEILRSSCTITSDQPAGGELEGSRG